MLNVRVLMLMSIAISMSLATVIGGCEKEAPSPSKPPAADPPRQTTHTPDDGHDHGTPPLSTAGHHHGPTTQLGEQTVSGFTIKASRDGDITPGGDAAIDVQLTGAKQVSVVRFWIGLENAAGSVKARAPFEAGHAHTHAELPSPLPPGSMLWVEIETTTGEKVVTSFNLNL